MKVIQSIYEQGRYQVNYNGNLSYTFSASQGVFQGSILSPHLYNDYTENLLKDIEQAAPVGTTVHGYYSGIVAYADDIILMSPTIGGLQELLDRCMKYFGNTAINLNVAKTEFIRSGTTKTPPENINNEYISLDVHFITPQDSLKHLGFLWNVKKSGAATLNDKNVTERINKFWTVVYSLIKGGIRYCNPQSIAALFESLAIPTLTYGLELCSLTGTQMTDLDREGRKALKQLFNVSKHSRNHLNKIMNIHHISTIINNNKINLFTRLIQNEGTRRIVLAEMCEGNNHRSFVSDVVSLCNSVGYSMFDLLAGIRPKKILSTYDEIPEETIHALTECCTFWNVASKRCQFRDIMEEFVPRT